MNRIIISIAALALIGVGSSIGAEPANANDQQAAALVKEIQAQQAQMAENQAAIEKKLATVAEAVRQARIYATRGGH
jgi:hypothetical protein